MAKTRGDEIVEVFDAALFAHWPGLIESCSLQHVPEVARGKDIAATKTILSGLVFRLHCVL